MCIVEIYIEGESEESLSNLLSKAMTKDFHWQQDTTRESESTFDQN